MEFLDSWQGVVGKYFCEVQYALLPFRKSGFPLQVLFHDRRPGFGERMYFFCRSHRLRTRSSTDSCYRRRLSSRWDTRLPLICLDGSLAGKNSIVRVVYVCLHIHRTHALIYAYGIMNRKTWISLHVCAYVSACIHV